jgi:hypothetical protein
VSDRTLTVLPARPRRHREMNNRLIISLLCAGALAFACGPRSRSRAPVALVSALPTPESAPVTPAPAIHIRRRDAATAKAQVKLAAKLDVAVASNEVRFALVVTNIGDKHAELNFPSGQSYDFVVIDSVGREVWRWARGRMFTQSVQNQQLGVRDAMRVSEKWTPAKAKAKPGRYTAIATLNSTNYPVEERVDFVLR